MICFPRSKVRDPKRPNPWHDLGLVLLAAALVATICLLWSCGERAASGVVHRAAGAATGVIPAPPEPTSTAEADDQLKAERRARRELADQLDASDRRIAGLEHDRADLVEKDQQHQLAWFSGIALIVTLAFVPLWFILPAGLKSWAVYGGMACLGLSAAALGLRALVPYREAFGLGMVAVGAAFGLWKLARFKRVGAEAADHGERLEEAFIGMKDWISDDKHALIDDRIADVKKESAAAQAKAGVRGILAAIRGKDPKKQTATPSPSIPILPK